MIWLCSIAAAIDLPPLPDQPPIPATQARLETDCPRTVALVRGEPIPAELLDPAGRMRCDALAVPVGDAADLLRVEAHRDALDAYTALLRARWAIDTAALRREIDWADAEIETLRLPPPIVERPAVQRTIGRVETLVTVAAVATVFYAASSAGEP